MSYTTNQLIEKFRQLKVVPVIALDNAEDILPLADTLAQNGLPVAEITFRSPAAAEAIRLLRQQRPEFLIAAGTVLTAEQVVAAKNSGADVVVTPGFNPKIVQLCQDLALPITPGVNNPMAIEAALDVGIETVKFFPAEASGGVKMIKALLGPYAQLQIMPTGGIGMQNIKDYLAIPNVVACGGSWFVEKKLINEKSWQEIGRLTKEVAEWINT
ncbi:bifunctional 4-hydroxy-2-oxoglutarate aldolase/2-dehydro-3-deoxy-phosphogluconate aldolase [Aggregatibacter actinomycetemcomitans]|uniref:bifunctional 4-hydroxy-2-oxoglutarate aldolase/2-dehydro-3-deoxy-phosphogluconate aldolase n=1 Tax=Aggregatibacter actinomycetemcomitans TaxID=714 RepID=UPI00022ADEF4|nr:bifunctional 4-hydroxy-2-oxoglutarate aldolase/2-dehydro-3-deoxy-phosphogluconate aldolase [Aggregatibacter actinomycetemcomitans]AEW77789.1 keto-hydroxyglutarate-aldolase/keto-deoxy-phosphogluconate aldolase [Aggregatibacter actinomycetemcomitans ANH9381]AHN72515.1 4-hydroxy-2-oxoglutarate aldolase, putative [Aggregatibacter actinomycetemcomitans HK1651]AMQ91883.1 2-dehydro-3-deoxyphosphogluconate aldolase [Aggregatibacter actinomycetemcomitans]KND82973.1 2-dehydro-3-deoxyphosphogluconate a